MKDKIWVVAVDCGYEGIDPICFFENEEDAEELAKR